jgi:hypothetical protein
VQYVVDVEAVKAVTALIGSIATLLWCIVVAVALALFWKRIRALLERDGDVEVEIPGVRLRAGAEIKREILKPVFDEVSTVVTQLSPELRGQFIKIREVVETGAEYRLPESFLRHSPEHMRLGKLRALQLIRPSGGGRWRPGERAELTNFARLAMKLAGKDLSQQPTLRETVR